MKALLTPKQVARAIGASEASLKRWCDKGVLPCTRTAGGHRRLPLNEVVQFVRRNGHRLVSPEVLGLPSATGTGEVIIERALRDLVDALVQSDAERARTLLMSLYLAGHKAVTICDAVLAKAFHQLGERWQHGDIEIYHERRACELTLAALRELRSYLPTVPEQAPIALGGTCSDDHYTVATAMVELALREAGWAAHSYGTHIPLGAWRAAIMAARPRLFWLSVSHIADVERFVREFQEVYAVAEAASVSVAVGGRALTPALRERMRFTAHCDTLQHLVDFASLIAKSPGERPTPPPAAPAPARA